MSIRRPSWLQDGFSLGAIFLITIWISTHASEYFLNSDAGQYLSTTDQLVAGEGLQTTALYYESQLRQGMPAAQTIWPPGLPLLAALVVRVFGIDGAHSIIAVNLLAHALTAVLLYWALAQLLAPRRLAAAVIAIFYCAYWIAWRLVLEGASEPLFVLSILAVAGCLFRSLQSGAISWAWLLGAAVFSAVACLFRYQGVPFAISFGLVVLIVVGRRTGFGKGILAMSLLLIPAASVLLAMFARNLLVVGSIRGAPETQTGGSFIAAVIDFSGAIFDLTGAGHILYTRIAFVVLVIVLGIWTVSALSGRGYILKLSDQRLVVFLYGVFAATLNVLMFLLRSMTLAHFAMHPRYLLPSLVLVTLSVAAIWPKVEGEIVGNSMSGILKSKRFASTLIVVSVVCMATIAALNSSRQLGWFAEYAKPNRMKDPLGLMYKDSTVAQFLSASASIEAPILSNQSQALYILIRKPTVGIPIRRFAKSPWSKDQILKLAQEMGVKYLCVFPDIPMGKTLDQDPILQMLQEVPSSLTPVFLGNGVALYEIDGAEGLKIPLSAADSGNSGERRAQGGL